ncbi:MAG: hypothetical protein PHX78_07185 [bacterium]|nr:hypothetical protein [bacterium]
MSDKKLRIDDSINIETHSQIRYNAAGEQRVEDEKFYTKDKNLLETGVVYALIVIGVLAGIIIYLRVQSYHSKREKEMIDAVEKQKDNEKQKNKYLTEVNALKNSISEIKNTDVMKYSSTEISESEAAAREADAELKKSNFAKVTELTKNGQDKLEEASNKAKRIMDANKEKELAKQKELEDKKRAEEEKQKRDEKKRKEIEAQKQREDALKQLKEIENMIKK